MKTFNGRLAIIILVIAMMGVTDVSNGASALLRKREEGKIGLEQKETFSAKEKKEASVVLWRERAAINQDLTAINQQQAKVQSLKEQYKEERAAGLNTAATYSDLKKAKADLKRDKAYLCADKAELTQAHRQIINQREQALANQRAEIREAKKKLDADLAEGKASAVLHAQAIVDKKQDLKQKENALTAARLNRDSDLELVNREIRDAKGESALVLTVEDRKGKNQVAMRK